MDARDIYCSWDIIYIIKMKQVNVDCLSWEERRSDDHVELNVLHLTTVLK